MNLRTIIDIIHAGGTGSGPTAPCPQCGPQGSPAGHSGAHTYGGPVPKGGGKFSGKQKTSFKKAGMLVGLKKPAKVFVGTPENSKNVVSKTLKYNPSDLTSYYHSIVKGYGIPEFDPGPKGKAWSAEMPGKPHESKGKFSETVRSNVHDNSATIVYDSAADSDGNKTTVFVNKERTGQTSSRVGIVEVTQTGFNEILSTKAKAFTSSKKALDFINNRYGHTPVWKTGPYKPRKAASAKA